MSVTVTNFMNEPFTASIGGRRMTGLNAEEMAGSLNITDACLSATVSNSLWCVKRRVNRSLQWFAEHLNFTGVRALCPKTMVQCHQFSLLCLT